jgi:tetratricopeptide (TPR) repeat protein
VIAERALFLPSVAVVIAVAVAGEVLIRSVQVRTSAAPVYAGMAAALLLIAGIGHSSSRNSAWHDNASLIEQNVQDLPLSWHAHMMMAQLHSERGKGPQALEETELAVRLGARDDFHLLAFAADMYQMQGRCDKAAGYYQRSLAIAPDQPQVKANAAICASHMIADAK